MSWIRRFLRFFWSREGRLGRRGFWLGGLTCNAAALLVAVIGDDLVPNGILGDLALALALLVCLAPLLPLSIRRLHDHDKSPAWLLTGLIPIVGPLWRLLELDFLPGTPSENHYGEPPAC